MEAKRLSINHKIFPKLAIIKSNFPVPVNTITALERRLPLVDSIKLVEKLKEKMLLEPFATKLNKVLEKNPGFSWMQKVARVPCGSVDDFEGNDPNEPAILANAPVVSCDVERRFSALTDVNVPKRCNLSEEHVKDALIIQWNGASST